MVEVQAHDWQCRPLEGCTADCRYSQELRLGCPGKELAWVGLASSSNVFHGKADEEDFYQKMKHNSQGNFYPPDPKPLWLAQAPHLGGVGTTAKASC